MEKIYTIYCHRNKITINNFSFPSDKETKQVFEEGGEKL